MATLLYLLLWGAFYYAGSQFGMTRTALMICHWTIAIFLGLEGQNLIARKLARQGWRLADVVEARDLPEAERRYFERALAGEALPPRLSALPPSRPQQAGPVSIIGLFPEAQGR